MAAVAAAAGYRPEYSRDEDGTAAERPAHPRGGGAPPFVRTAGGRRVSATWRPGRAGYGPGGQVCGGRLEVCTGERIRHNTIPAGTRPKHAVGYVFESLSAYGSASGSGSRSRLFYFSVIA